jgi:hypothetical protein
MGVRREVRGQMALDLPPELTRRSEWWEERRAERAAMRAEVKEARRHGLDARHAAKLIRLERSWLTASDGPPAASVVHGVPAGVTPRRPMDARIAASIPLATRPVDTGNSGRTPAPAVAAARATTASSAETTRRHEPATATQAGTAARDHVVPQPAERTPPHQPTGQRHQPATATQTGTTAWDHTAPQPDTATGTSPAASVDRTREAKTAVETDAADTTRATGGTVTAVDDATSPNNDATSGSDTAKSMPRPLSVNRTRPPTAATPRPHPTAACRGPPTSDVVAWHGRRPNG